MNTKTVQTTTVISCKGRPTRDWYAWNNLMLPPPDDFHVTGEVQVSNPGVMALLCPKEPQGDDPAILLLDLYLVQQPGIWPQIMTWVQARYDKIIVGDKYQTVEIYCEDEKIAEVPVEDIQ
jgi:hypothetical protein